MFSILEIVLLLYLVFSFFVTILNFITSQIGRGKFDLKNQPFISILIPARNEGKNIQKVLKSIVLQKYSNSEIIVLDDKSEDDTYLKAKEILKEKGRVIRGKEKHEDWIGKQWACSQLATYAKGEYLLFLDADVYLHGNAIEKLMKYAVSKKTDLLSVMPYQESNSFFARLVIYLFMHSLSLNNLPYKIAKMFKLKYGVLACGQCMLFRRESYLSFEGHSVVKKSFSEDIEIARYMMSKGYNVEMLWKRDILSCNMYDSLKESHFGFGRSFVGVAGGSILSLLLWLIVLLMNISPLFFFDSYYHSLFVYIIYFRELLTLYMYGYPLGFLLLYIPKIFLGIGVVLRSIYNVLSGKIMWKGREY